MVTESPRLVFGTGVSDIAQSVDISRMREFRATRARGEMAKRGYGALLVTGSENVRYLTGYWNSDFQPQLSYTLFPAEGEPVVFAHAGSYHQMQDQVPWVTEWRIGRSWLGGIAGAEAVSNEAERFAMEIRAIAAERGIADEPIGVVDFDNNALHALRGQGLIIEDASQTLLDASAIKSQDEINCLKLGATLSTRGFQTAVESLKPGVTDVEVAGAMRASMLAAGAEAAASKVHSGPLAFERSVSRGNRIIEHGDTAYFSTCGTSYMGYTVCLYRSSVVGRQPTAKEKSWHAELVDRIDRIIDAIRPGATTADAAQHFPPAAKWGYADEAEVLTVEFGHGIGLVSLGSRYVHYNAPVINRQWSFDHPQAFEPGMVIAIETLEGAHRQGGVRIENMVEVTQDGARLLDLYPRDLLVVGS